VLGVLPAQRLAGLPLVGAAAVPPVSAQAVGRAAVAAATDPAVPAGALCHHSSFRPFNLLVLIVQSYLLKEFPADGQSYSTV